MGGGTQARPDRGESGVKEVGRRQRRVRMRGERDGGPTNEGSQIAQIEESGAGEGRGERGDGGRQVGRSSVGGGILSLLSVLLCVSVCGAWVRLSQIVCNTEN